MEGLVRDRFRLIYLKSPGHEHRTVQEAALPNGQNGGEKAEASHSASQIYSSQAHIDQAKADLEHSEARIRILAIRFLEQGEPSVAFPLVQDALTDHDPEVRVQAVLSLIRLGNPGAASLLKKLLADCSPKVKLAALRGISRLGEGLDPDALRQLFCDESPWVRRKMATLLGWAHREEGARPILEALTRDPVAAVRRAALHSLVTLYPAESEDRFTEATADRDADLRTWARKALERMADKPVAPQGTIGTFKRS